MSYAGSPESARLLNNGDGGEAPQSYAASVSQYNAGPRKATDKWFGVVFVICIISFIGWSSSGIGEVQCGKTNKVWAWDFDPTEWTVQNGVCKRDPATCVRVTPAPTMQVNMTKGEASAIADLVIAPVMVAFLGGFILGALLLIGFKFQPYAMVYIACFVQILAPAALGVYLIHLNGVTATTDAGTQNQDGSDAFTYPAYFLFAISALLALVYYWFRASLKLCAEMFRFSAIGLENNLCILPVQGLFFLLAVMFKILIIGLGVCFICAFEVTPDDPNDPEDTHPCSADVESSRNFFYFFFTLTFGWFAFWALETRNYIVADVMSHWYWEGSSGADIQRGVKHAFCSHFGSMAFAGLATWFIERLKAAARTRPNHPLACIIVLIARCILSYVEYLFKMAVLMVAITGKSFASSGIEVGRLFWSSFGNLYHSAGVWMFPGRILGTLNFIMALAIGAAYGGAAYHPTLKDCNNGDFNEFMTSCASNDDANADGDCLTCSDVATYYSVASGFGIFFVVIFLLSLFAGILLVILDTTFLCFLLDKQAGVVTKPQFHAIFGTVLEHRAKSMATATANQSKEPPSYLRGAPAPAYTPNGQPQPVGAAPSTSPPGYAVAPGPAAYPQQGYQQQPQGYPQPTYPQYEGAPSPPQQQYGAVPPSGANFDPMTGQPIGKQ